MGKTLSIRQLLDCSEREFWERIFGSEDAREGAAAFGEKRDPVWKGR